MPIFKSLKDQPFGRLTATGQYERRGRRYFWLCNCDCGNAKWIAGEKLTSGNTSSCGCLRRELAAAAHYKHGGKGTIEYLTWKNMKARCHNEKNRYYADYGGRGITVHPSWRDDFARFLADMGLRPEGCDTIERIDNDRGYEPGNCKWATHLQQARNTRRNRLITYNGLTKPLSQWCDELGLHYGAILARIDRLGWDVARALETPIHDITVRT